LRIAYPFLRASAAATVFFYPNDLNEAYQLPSFRGEVDPLGVGKTKLQTAGVGVHIGIVMSSVIRPRRSG
jgi:hypothetical protein